MAVKRAGYRRKPGSARRYIGPGGNEISYRQYRAGLAAENLISPLGPVELANRRRQQRAFNDIINQMAKIRRQSIQAQLDYAEELGDEETVEDLAEELRHLKSTLIKSEPRKTALHDLKQYAHKRDAESLERTKLALVALGRREGIPDWVPVGGSDRFRTGSLRKDRIPKNLRPLNTRLSKG